jgi:hypothetical protein
MSEVPDLAWAQYERDQNVEELATKRALFFRSVFVPSLACALNTGRAANGDAFANFEDQVEQRL